MKTEVTILDNIFFERLCQGNFGWEDCILTTFNLSYQGPTLTFGILTRQIPLLIPSKWPDSTDTVYLEFDLFDIERVLVKKFGRENRVEVVFMEGTDDCFTALFKGGDCEIEIEARWLRFQRAEGLTTDRT